VGSGVEFLDLSGVAKIGPCALRYCKRLSSCELPDGLAAVSVGCFEGCSALSTIELPESVVKVEGRAFYEAGIVEIPLSSVQEIGSDALVSCPLANVTLSDSVTAIGSRAFAITRLVEIFLPASLQRIGSSMLSSCARLKHVSFGAPVAIADGLCQGCSALASVQFHPQTTSIGDSAFSGCASLGRLELPEGLTALREGAFGGCRGMRQLTVGGKVGYWGKDVFSQSGGVVELALNGPEDCENWSALILEALSPDCLILHNGQPLEALGSLKEGVLLLNVDRKVQWYHVFKHRRMLRRVIVEAPTLLHEGTFSRVPTLWEVDMSRSDQEEFDEE
jgi:hypothetical protein